MGGSSSNCQARNGNEIGAREVLVLETEDDSFGQSNSENRYGNYGAICTYRGKTGFSMESFEDLGAVMGEAIPGPGPCSTYTKGSLGILWMNSFVPKAILHW